MATPLFAVTVVVPAAKLPEERARWILSLFPVLGLVMALPNWSSTVTPTLNAVPAETEDGGAVVTTSLFSGPGLIVSACVPVWRPLEAAEIVGEPAFVSP